MLVKPTGTKTLGISDQDIDIATIRKLICELSVQVNDLNKKIDNSEQALEDAIQTKRRHLAGRHLRSRKSYEGLLVKRTRFLEQLESAYDGIRDALEQRQMLNVLQLSTSILRGLNSDLRDLGDVSTIFEEWQEEINQVGDVTEATNTLHNLSTVDDEDAVAAELDELEREELAQRLQSTEAEQASKVDRADQQSKSSSVVESPSPSGAEDLASQFGRMSVSEEQSNEVSQSALIQAS